MNKLILNPISQTRADNLRESPPQSLLLHGEHGTGLFQIANYIARDKNPIVIKPEGESQVLSIKTERIRQLYSETKNTAAERRFVIIDDADKMTLAAQAAFLKLLEEPNQHTYFILTSHDKDRLLTTVLSRVQSHYLPLPTSNQVSRLIDRLAIEDTMRKKIAFIAPRQPSLVYQYVNDQKLFENDSQIMTDARKCLASTSSYERQTLALKHSSNRNQAIAFIDACLHILRFTLESSTQSVLPASLEDYLDTRDRLEKNANVKLTLIHLMV